MAENPPSEGTRKLEEDGGPEDCYDSDDDLIMYADGRKMSIQLQKEYHRQVKESEGFDITLDLTLDAAIGAPIIPQRDKENKPKFVDLSQLAIATFNSQNLGYKVRICVKCYCVHFICCWDVVLYHLSSQGC
ncbi:uncharacterized protein LOC107825271 isoform X1 [Nicotiana tabacum]|uniref:Uncharacterized protein LOC107825271 isoform X1 n=3 Tax=Nicotiana tabacum TaxID=4097 RepID=A0AC58U6H7_TOBAC